MTQIAQTTIDWLVKQLEKPINPEILIKAKEMEKKQLISFAYEQIFHIEVDEECEIVYNRIPEELYQEIFKQQTETK